jgi:hypothetical protein
MMAINFPAAFLGLKVPNQIMYCISQDNSASPVVVYKDVQNSQHSVVPWSNPETVYTQTKEIQQIGGAVAPGGSQPQSIRVEAGNQVSFSIGNLISLHFVIVSGCNNSNSPNSCNINNCDVHKPTHAVLSTRISNNSSPKLHSSSQPSLHNSYPNSRKKGRRGTPKSSSRIQSEQ